MTPEELQSFAVQVVRDHLADAGRLFMSWSDNPDVSPSLWFVGDSGPEWVVVTTARYPAGEALPGANFADRRQGNSAGYDPMLLYRAYGMRVEYGGLEGEGE